MDVTLLSGVVRNRKVSMRVFIAIFFYICMFNYKKSLSTSDVHNNNDDDFCFIGL
jgi:hypothetical protein